MRLTRTRDLKQVLDGYRSAPFTYVEIGATAGPLPAGYAHQQFRRRIGQGRDAFERASTALLNWGMHEGAGMTVAADGPAEVDRTVVLALGRPFGLVIPCRVVYVVGETQRKGFAYGTLPGHPEDGEEAFVVEIDDAGVVWADITAFSRPGSNLVRWSGPLGPTAQKIALRVYTRSLQRLAKNDASA